MKLLKNTIWAMLFLLSAIGVQAEDIMSLEDAIRIGLKNNYEIQMARNDARAAANNRGLGTSGLLPTVDASGSYLYNDADEETNPGAISGDAATDTWGASVSMNWTLFDGFKMFVEKERYNELALLGEIQARRMIENTVVNISRTYFALVAQEQLLGVAVESRDISRVRLDKEKVRNDLGASSSTDYLNAQVSFNNDQSSLLNRELEISTAREELNVVLGRDPATPVTVNREIVIPSLEANLKDLRDLAFEHNAGLRAAEQNKRVADRFAQGTKASFLPKLSLNASYGYTDRNVSPKYEGATGDIATERTDATVGLALTYNFFNGFRDKISRQNARIEANNQALALRDTRNRLEGLVRRTYETFWKRTEIMMLEQDNVTAAQQNLDRQMDRFQLGSSTSLEFRDAQVQLARARIALITARYQTRISRLELEQLVGALDVE